MKQISSTAIIAEDNTIINKTNLKDNNSPYAYTYSKEIKSSFGVETSDLSINEHLNAISILKTQKKEDFLNSKILRPLSNAENKEEVLLKTIAEQTFKRDSAFFYNKTQTVYDLVKHYQFEQCFITVTSLKSRKKAKNLQTLANTNIAIKSEFNELFRTLFKQRIFKTALTSSSRFYLRSNEFTKEKYLHTHFLFMTSKENIIGFINTFKEVFINHAKRLHIGRTELVIPYHQYQALKGSTMLKEVKGKKENILILNDKAMTEEELKMLGRDNYFYIKCLKRKKPKMAESGNNNELDEAVENAENEIDDSVIKYALKYVFKDFKDKLSSTSKHGICSVSSTDTLYSISKIRRINFSRFTFPKYLFHGLKNKKGENLYDKFKLKALSILHIEKKIEVVLKENMDFKTIKKTIRENIIHDRNKYDLDISDNLCLFTLATGTEKAKEADRLVTELFEIRKYLKMLDKCNDFEELSYFLSDEFGIEYDFESENIKYTLIAENETLSNKFLKYIVIEGEKWYYDYSIKYILMDKTE
jgi:hypothetical protein